MMNKLPNEFWCDVQILMKVKMNSLSNLISFPFLANEESSLIKMELDDNDQEERYSIHSLVWDSYSPLGVILRRRGERKKTVN